MTFVTRTPFPCPFSVLSSWWACHVDRLHSRMVSRPRGLAPSPQGQGLERYPPAPHSAVPAPVPDCLALCRQAPGGFGRLTLGRRPPPDMPVVDCLRLDRGPSTASTASPQRRPRRALQARLSRGRTPPAFWPGPGSQVPGVQRKEHLGQLLACSPLSVPESSEVRGHAGLMAGERAERVTVSGAAQPGVRLCRQR